MTSTFLYGTFHANEHVCLDTDHFGSFDNWLCNLISENWQLTLINFHRFHYPQKFSNNELFPDCSITASTAQFELDQARVQLKRDQIHFAFTRLHTCMYMKC